MSMEAAYEFALSGDLIEFTLHRILEGRTTTPTLFNAVMAEKCQLINYHFSNTRDHLKLAVNVSNMTATIAFHNISIEDSQLKSITIHNTPELEKQLVYLWQEVQQILKHFNEEDRLAEMASIESFYRNYEYKKHLSELFTYEFF